MTAIVIGGIPAILTAALSNLIRAIGKPRAASFGMTMGAVLNIVLDTIFMFALFPKGCEVIGAALATALSNTVSLGFFFVYMARNRHESLFCRKPFSSSGVRRFMMDEVRCGTPSFLQLIRQCFLIAFPIP